MNRVVKRNSLCSVGLNATNRSVTAQAFFTFETRKSFIFNILEIEPLPRK
jgi:hypothetical protein